MAEPMNGASQSPQPEPKSIAVAQLVGFVLFSIGSACFVWMSWVDDWVLPLRLGCGLWIGGCVPYLWPPLRNAYVGPSPRTHLSNALQVIGMLCWAVGSACAFHSDLDTYIWYTNGGFLSGSVCLLSDALLQCSPEWPNGPGTRDEQVSLLADLFAGLCYVLAGGFGGYATEPGLLRFGNACWLVGSLISGTRPCLALCAKNESDSPTCKSVELEAVACSTSASAA